MSYISEIPDRIPRVMSYFLKDLLQKKVKHVLQSWSNPASRKVMRRSVKFWRIQCTSRKKLFLLDKGSRMSFMLANLSKETLFQSESQKVVMRLVRHYDQDERETDGAVNWILWFQNCEELVRSLEDENSRTRIGFNTFIKEATRWGSSIAWIPRFPWCIFVPFKDTLVGIW